MDDAELFYVLMDASTDPDREEHEMELMARARAGNRFCRRLAYRMLESAWDRRMISTSDYIAKTEFIAAPNAANGDEESTLCLAGVWLLAAFDLRQAGQLERAHSLEVDAATMVGVLANNGSDKAVAEFNNMRRVLSPEVFDEVKAELWCDAANIPPQPEPELLQAEARLEAQARFWGWQGDDDSTIQ